MADLTVRQSVKGGSIFSRWYRELSTGYFGPYVFAISPGVTRITPTITVDTAAHTSGDSIGGKITLSNAVRVSGGAGVLRSVTIVDLDDQKAQCSIILFNADPAAGTYTTNGAVTIHATDALKVIARIPVVTADYVTVGGVAIGQINLDVALQAVGSTSLYALINTTSTPTYTATTGKLQVSFGIEQH